MNPLHGNDVEMSSPPQRATLELTQSQDFQSNYLALKKNVEDTELIVEKLYEEAKKIHAKELEELEEKENTLFGAFRRTLINLKHAFLNNIPAPSILVLKQVQPVLFMILAILAYGTILAFFIYFFVNGIMTGQKNKFISLTLDSGNCEEVDTTLNLKQYISQNGAWQGFRRFSFHKAKYIVNFQSFDAKEFSTYMANIFNVVVNLGEQAKSLPLYWNLITWSTYTHYDFKQLGKEETVTTFEFTGDTSAIFNRQYRDNAISNSGANCKGEVNSYDYYHGVAEQGWNMVCNATEACTESVYDYKFPGSNSSCDSVLTPDILSSIGWNPKYGASFNLKLDLVSVMTAVSLNLGVTNSTNLENANIEVEGVSELQSYFDARYPNMDPIFCTYDAVAEGQKRYDGSYYGSYYGSYGGSYGGSYFYGYGPGSYGGSYGGSYFYGYEPGDYYNSYFPLRKLQEFGMGMGGEAPKTFKEKILMQKLMKRGVKRLDELSMNDEPKGLEESDDELAPYCYARLGEQFCLPVVAPYFEKCMNCTSYDACKSDDDCDPTTFECHQIDVIAACIYDPTDNAITELPNKYNQSTLFEMTRQAAVEGMTGAAVSLQDWCPGCLIYIFNAYDTDFNINEYRYQLSPANKSVITGRLESNYGHCEDSFTIPKKEWSQLISSPPAPLVEIYYQCTKRLNDVVFDSFGIASSNALTIGLPVLSMLIASIFMFVAATKILNLPKDVIDKLAGKRELKRSHIEEKLIEVDQEYAEANKAHKKALDELKKLNTQYMELKGQY